MAKCVPFDMSDQPTFQEAQSHSAAMIVSHNDPKCDDSLNPACIAENKYDEVREARRAVTGLSVDHPDWLHKAKALTSLLSKLFEETSQDTLLAECIDIQRQICALCATGHPDRAIYVSDLASSLRTRFMQTGEEVLLAEGIDLNREALSLRPYGHPDRSISCINLASSLWARFEQTGEQSLLTEVINFEREALSLRPRGHPDRSISCNSLAVSLHTRFNQTGEESLIAEAIDLQSEALSLRPKWHPDRSKLCNNLAILLCARFDRTGVESLLTEAIELHREALTLRPSGHFDRSMTCNNLAVSLKTRFKKTGEESFLTEAIEFYREALSLRPSGHPDRFVSCNNLASALWTRFDQTGEESLLTEAIELHREALSLRPSGHHHRYISCSNLALSLCARFKQAREESLLVEAIHLHREALFLQTSTHPDRLEACNRLVASLRTYFDLTGDESVLVEAIELTKDAMKTQPQHHPRRWYALINLIHIYLDRRFSQHNVVLAIDYIQQALSLISDDWPTLLSEVAQVNSLIDLPKLSHDSLSQLLHCFSSAIDLASRVAGFVLDPKSQLRYLKSSKQLGPRAYWCALACRQPQLGLELIERARAVIWAQALHIRNPQLSGAPPELASELKVLLSRMHALRGAEDATALSSHKQDVRHKSSDRIHQLIQQIRALPGQEKFMRGPSSKELAQCASHNVVVVLVATEGECHALILKPNSEEPITFELANISPDELTAMSIVTYAAQMRGAAPDDVHYNRMGMKAQVLESNSNTHSKSVLEKLWMGVVRPVIHFCGFQKSSGSLRPRLHWCPTGAFMFLPLHAAGTYDASGVDRCTDYVVSSYTPTLTALLRAQNSRSSFHKREAKLGLVAAKETRDVCLPALRFVEDEINLVRAAAESARILVHNSNSCVGNAITVTRASDVLKNTNLVHIACHGTQNTFNALSSGYCLSDGNLSVSRLMDLDLKDAFFAFLSACETAKGDEKQPDQTVHLAAAMLFVGFRSVVATMWAMNDTDGPFVAELFYKRLFAEDVITLEAVPYALDYAVEELRKTGVSAERWATFIHMGA